MHVLQKQNNKIKSTTKKKSGFTLIELLVVIAIISVLSAIALTSFNSARTKAKNAAAKGKMRRLTDTMQVATGKPANH